MQPTTYQKQNKATLFVPDERFMLSIMQGKYRQDLWGRRLGDKQIAVIYDNLPVDKDEEAAIEAMQFIGCLHWYILNDKTSNITKDDIWNARTKIVGQFKSNPSRKYFGFVFVAGHGILREGEQHLMLNFTNKYNPKFFLSPIEKIVRDISSNYSNSYIVCAFACCREIFSLEGFKKLVIAPTQSEAEEMIKELEQAEKEDKKKYKVIDKDTYIKMIE